MIQNNLGYGANVSCISDVTDFIRNPIEWCFDVKNDLVFNFEKKNRMLLMTVA